MSNQNNFTSPEEEKFSLVQECTDEYRVEKAENGTTKIIISIPEKYSNLWMHKLSELKTTMKEIKEYE